MHVVAAPDKFKGTASAVSVAEAIGAAIGELGFTADLAPMADGGEGTLLALGGANRESTVTGPLGDSVIAPWRLSDEVAVIEMALASGLELVGGGEGNDPVDATTTGTGELIAEAIEAGARRILVGVGGSATTDGGLGAVRALPSRARLGGVELLVVCDVRTRFVDAAEVFGPQKGASPAQVELLKRRLDRLAQVYLDEFGVDVSSLDRAGAAGGLGGGLAALGGELVDGFTLVADEVHLYERVEAADVVITGEGRLDATSFEGKVVGGVAELAKEAGVPVVAVVGSSATDLTSTLETIDLSTLFGPRVAFEDPVACVRSAIADRFG